MPIHSVANFVENATESKLVLTAAALFTAVGVKVWSGGRSCTRERDWAGKMILIVALPTPTTLSLIHHLLHLPKPPQILYLPPIPSPLPEDLLVILQTIRLSITNPLAQLYCEALPPTPRGVRDFTKQWGTVTYATAGEGGRRVDAIILGDGWGLKTPIPKLRDTSEDPDWITHQFHFHLLTSLLPHLLRAPAERNIRVITLVSPGWASAIPALQGTLPKRSSPLQESGRNGVKTLLATSHFQRILDTLASAAYAKPHSVPVPDPEGKLTMMKKRDESIWSNVMAVSVIMGWAREEVVKELIGSDGWRWILWILFYPLIILITPSPSKSIQSILFALSAPVRYGPIDDSPLARHGPSQGVTPDGASVADTKSTEGGLDVRRNMVAGGDVVRDCAVVDMPPILSDPILARETYETIEKEVEKGVREGTIREKAYPPVVNKVEKE